MFFGAKTRSVRKFYQVLVDHGEGILKTWDERLDKAVPLRISFTNFEARPKFEIAERLLKHQAAGVEFLGFAGVVFVLFLEILFDWHELMKDIVFGCDAL